VKRETQENGRQYHSPTKLFELGEPYNISHIAGPSGNDKQDHLQYLTMEEAVTHCRKGVSSFPLITSAFVVLAIDLAQLPDHSVSKPHPRVNNSIVRKEE
jgi:hypothetical protein